MSLIGQLNVSQSQLVAGVNLHLLMWCQFLSIDLRPVERAQILDKCLPVTVLDACVPA
jgi:hypothetical protein